ncbi:hypothetical protein FPV67DRAFT_113445 [Lyophyllum atratum]|nr:hypothetical protein FPV67DRAFT_113445 [Lyophyllum atratum]
MAFAHAQNTVVYDSTFTHVGGDSNTYNFSGSEPGIVELLKVISPGAAYNSQEREPPARCHPGTRKDVLEKMMGWVGEAKRDWRNGVLWLHGPVGAGKSAIAQTICERCAEQRHLAASFFFSQGRAGRDTNARFITTIAFHLARSIPGLWIKVKSVIESDPMVIHSSTDTQTQKLIIETFRSIETPSSPSVVVIDGLDECDGNDAQIRILVQILEIVRKSFVPLRFIILSRPEPHIEHSFRSTSLRDFTSSISLYGEHKSLEDVRTYLVTEFERIYSSERHSAIFETVPLPFPSKNELDLLVKRSDGYFIYASTIIRYVDEEYYSPIERLDTVLNASSSSLESGPFDELDILYRKVLSSSCRNLDLLKRILGYILAGPKPLNTGGAITEILRLKPGQLSLTLRGLHSILCYESPLDEIFPFHTSFSDFIFDPRRAGIFHVDPQTNYNLIFRDCWDCLETWSRSRTTHGLGSAIIVYLRACLCQRGTYQVQDDIVQEITSTDIYFWKPHVGAAEDKPVSKDTRIMTWLTETVKFLETLSDTFPRYTRLA